jgi:adenylate cyclase
MTRRGLGPIRRRLVLLCGLVPVALTAVLALYRPPFLARIDDTVYDMLMRSARKAPRGDRVAIVDIDERSLATVGQWPWRRDRVAELISRLRALGASTIALDIIFAEQDRFDAVEHAANASEEGSRGPDDTLAAALAQGHVIVGYGLTFDGGAPDLHGCVLHPISLAVQHPREESGEAPYFRADSAVCSLPALAKAAGASGFLNAAPDSDGILRRVPLVAELDGRTYPSLAVAAASAMLGAKNISLHVANVNSASLRIDDRIVPVDGKSNLLVRYRGRKKTFPYLSAADVMNGRLDPQSVRGKIVFVGTTALGTREVVATPLDTLFAGVEVQATVADDLLEESYIRRSALGAMLESSAALGLGLAIAALVAGTGVASGVIGCVAGTAGVWFAATWLLSSGGLFVSPLFPTIAAAGALAVMTLGRFGVERRRAESAGRERTAAQRLMVQTLLSLTEVRDAETGRHSRRTQQYARVLADALTRDHDFHEYLTPQRIDLLSSLAPLHDIGKVGIPDHILNKPGPLTPEEYVEMQKHPALGRGVILKAEQQVGVKDDATLAMAKDIVYTHHERWDGTGYPRHLHGSEIPVPGRIMAVVDVYDASVSRNLYRPSISHQQAVALIAGGKGTHFDPAVVDAFLGVADRFEEISREADSVQ